MTRHPDLAELLDRSDEPEVRDHLESCPPCRAKARLMEGVGGSDPEALPGIDAARRAMAGARDQAGRTMSMGGASDEDEPLASGRDLGRYVVEGWLGRGGMGSVYRVRHRQLGSVHALKVLRGTTGSERARLIREGRAQSAVRHPNIVAVTDVVEVDDAPGLVIELVDGPPLSSWLREHGAPSVELAERLGRQILRGVAAAHHAGLVHRDLKPGNVLLAPSDEGPVAKVADFGLARQVASPGPEETPLTRPGTPLGTPAYMAPEQIRDASLADARSDVFALGAVLYELCSGERAFVGQQAIDVWDAIRAGRYVPLAKVAPQLPRHLADTIQRALSVDPADRYADAGKMLDAWRGVGAVVQTRRTWLPWLSVGVAGSLVLSVGGFLAMNQPTASRPEPVERRLTAQPSELQMFAVAISPDGRLLATTDSRGAFVQDIDGGPQRQVLDQGPYHSIDFLPSGDRLVASGVRDGTEAVWEVDVGGGEVRRVLDTEARTAALSPDGKRLAWAAATGLWVADLADGHRTRLRPLNGVDETLELAWSPSGDTIAAIQRSASGASLELTAADGSSSRRLLEDVRLISLGLGPLTWVAPDRLVYALTSDLRDPVVELYALDGAEHATSTDDAVLLRTWEGMHVTQIRGSADGSRAVTSRITGRMQAWWTVDRAAPVRVETEDWEELPVGWLDDDHLLLYSLRPDPVLAVRDRVAGTTSVLRQCESAKQAGMLHDGALYGFSFADKHADPYTVELVRERVEGGEVEVLSSRTVRAGTPYERFQVRCGQRCMVSEPGDDGIVLRWMDPDTGALSDVVRTIDVHTRSMAWDVAWDGSNVVVLTGEPGQLRVISTDPAGPPDRVVPVDLSVAISVASEATGEGWIVAGLYDPSDHPYRV
ncbi:MAG: serine/threonine-protein kinase, partial [Myxococcales bacterium]|nr:serine/threonine-protein kinase [Myxococcales bacterium]